MRDSLYHHAEWRSTWAAHWNHQGHVAKFQAPPQTNYMGSLGEDRGIGIFESSPVIPMCSHSWGLCFKNKKQNTGISHCPKMSFFPLWVRVADRKDNILAALCECLRALQAGHLSVLG